MKIFKKILTRTGRSQAKYTVNAFIVLFGIISFGYAESQSIWKDERLPISPIWFPAPDIILSANESTLLKKLPKEEAYLDLGILYAQQGKWQRVLWASKELMKANPREANAYLAMAYSYCQLFYPSGALQVLEQGLRQSIPQNMKADIHRTKGDVYLYILPEDNQCNNSGSLLQAERAYRTAITYDASNCLAQIGMVRILIRKNNIAAAENAIRLAQANQSTRRERALVLYYKGQLLEKQGKINEAEEIYLKALVTHPESFRVRPTTGDWVVGIVSAAGLAMRETGMQNKAERLCSLLSKSRLDQTETLFLERRTWIQFAAKWKDIIGRHGTLKTWHLYQGDVEPLPQTPYENVYRWRLRGEMNFVNQNYQIVVTMSNNRDVFIPDWKVEKLTLSPCSTKKK